jgi:peptide-methionine (R)-S-oxide reductase
MLNIETEFNKVLEKHYGIINLSDYSLSTDELIVLGKGLKFCPTPPTFDHGLLKESIDKFFRSAAIKIFFLNKQDEESQTMEDIFNASFFVDSSSDDEDKPFDDKSLHLPSTWTPQMPSTLSIVYNKVIDELLVLDPFRTQRNLTSKQFDCIKKLRDNNQIVIKKADKGSNVVIQNIADYIAEGNRQLSDINFYREVQTDLTSTHRQLVGDLVNEMLLTEEISDKVGSYLLSGGTRTSVFYMLPKIHKNKTPPPGRPIVSSTDCPTEKISQFVDILLQPYVMQTKSYIKDTADFLLKISKITDINENDWLFTMDVTGLYTNIPHVEGMNAIKNVLRNRLDTYPSNVNILKMLDLVLTKNNFDFNGKHYLQINGTAMGTRVAPTYANLFMDYIERNYVYNQPIKPRIWFRFIDDVYGVFRGSEQDLNTFHSYMNNIHPTIKFTMEKSRERVVFLDVETFVKGNVILSKLYTKPTDSHSYLDYTSCHPSHIMTSIPYSQFLRMRRNNTYWSDFVISSIKLVQYLSLRGYSSDIVFPSLKKVNELSQMTALIRKDSNTDDDKTLYCITDYNPSCPSVKRIILKHWDLLENSSGTRKLMDFNIIFGNRKPKSLTDLIIRAKLPSQEKTQFEVPTCKRIRTCRYCPILNKSGKVYSTSTGRMYRIPTKISCNTVDVIYMLECQICHKQYVGQTRNKLLTRIGQHMGYIKNQDKSQPISRHMISHGWKGNDKYPIKISVLHLLREIPPTSKKAILNRDKQENLWMARLFTYVPKGLNVQD